MRELQWQIRRFIREAVPGLMFLGMVVGLALMCIGILVSAMLEGK